MYFLTLPTRTGEDTDNTDTDKEEREEGEGDVSSLLLTFSPSRFCLVCAPKPGRKQEEPSVGTTRLALDPERVLLT